MIDPHRLDIEVPADLLAYLRQTGRIAEHDEPRVTQLAGGVSNRTMLLEWPDGRAWVLKQALPKLRVAVEWLSDPRRIEREAAGMLALASLAPSGTITPLIFLDPEPHLLAMQAVPLPHENWKTMLLRGQVNPDHIRQFARLLGGVHLQGWSQRQSLAREFEDRSFFESLRVEPYYIYTAERVPEADSFINNLVAETRATRYTLVHGDYSPKNVLVHEGQLILLDHEVIHFGDGAFDLGFSLTHLLSKAHHIPEQRAEFAAAARLYWQEYRLASSAAPWSATLEPRAVRHTLGCMLARCRGRSPLEYLDEAKRAAQAKAVLNLMRQPPVTVDSLVRDFLAQL